MKTLVSRTYVYVFLLISAFGVFVACTEEDDTPNPYDTETTAQQPKETEPTDSASLASLQQRIFSLKCANPGCHDGSFEPDFRTAASTFATTVYHPLVKYDTTGRFLYRIEPYDTANSWLHERITTDDPVLGRMPLYEKPLSAAEIRQINQWIMRGAPDVNGVLPKKPDLLPAVEYYFALDAEMQNISDVVNRRDGWSSPFYAPANSAISVLVKVNDDNTPMPELLGGRLLISEVKDDFTNARVFNTNGLMWEHWLIPVNTAGLPTGKQLFMRFEFMDTAADRVGQMPRASQPWWYKEAYSMMVR